jgi:hypothetical protein
VSVSQSVGCLLLLSDLAMILIHRFSSRNSGPNLFSVTHAAFGQKSHDEGIQFVCVSHIIYLSLFSGAYSFSLVSPGSLDSSFVAARSRSLYVEVGMEYVNRYATYVSSTNREQQTTLLILTAFVDCAKKIH